jgi:hypothetical protein
MPKSYRSPYHTVADGALESRAVRLAAVARTSRSPNAYAEAERAASAMRAEFIARGRADAFEALIGGDQ